MGVLLEINRDFPFQIPLPFDDAGMEVLEWLDDALFRMGDIRRPAGQHDTLLLSNVSRRDGVQAAVRKWFGEKASCRRPALIGAGHIRSCCPRASVREAAATKRYMNSALI
jgi:hypothetical protein